MAAGGGPGYPGCRSTEDRRSPSNRSKVREQSRRPTQEDEAATPVRAGVLHAPAASCAGAFVVSGVPSVIADDTSQGFHTRRYAWPGLTKPPPSPTSPSSSGKRPRP
ncbi:hypothetical protein HMPREF0591_3764 [Mycobacterium parascrofulaceum ATCC BAA-614]|uniref:Uncharacterized protein n=1 Tax=Mycobacterium parascrofulaceum ATCC BAA-614 TaxID=525368 RepID=D5PC70_9MYCO|nr:hypothetical protein HMPREF0591_3764 [Mycobacterium parascrofulaceum ATCC BAA-614]